MSSADPPGHVITFVPGRSITIDTGVVRTIKGRAAPFTANAHFADVYAATPPRDLRMALEVVRSLLPEPATTADVQRQLLHPPHRAAGGIGTTIRSRRGQGTLDADSEQPLQWMERFTLPFRIAQAPDHKIADSLRWMHTYLSRAARRGGREPLDLFVAYATLLTCEDYHLARLVTPNVSIMMQRRLVGLLAPAALRADELEVERRNRAALALLPSVWAGDDLVRACGLATFSGTTWFAAQPGTPERARPGDIELAPGEGLDVFVSGAAAWGTDDRTAFVGAALSARRAAVIIDDSGELVFDLALLESLMRANPALHVSVLARREPGGIDATADAVIALVGSGHLPALRRFHAEGRVTVLAVAQDVASFESHLFTPRERNLLDRADVVLVKGAGFYETTVLNRPAYHAFVVDSETGRLLTGLPRGSGVFGLQTGPRARAADPPVPSRSRAPVDAGRSKGEQR